MTITLTPQQFEQFTEEQRRLSIRSNPPEVMNVEELAIFLDSHAVTIYSKVELGQIPFKRDGRRLKFLLVEIREWLKKSKDLSKELKS